MKDPMKPRDKITQKMSRDGLTEQNQTTGESELISKRIQDADFQKTPEQQAAQDAAQLQGAVSPSSPLSQNNFLIHDLLFDTIYDDLIGFLCFFHINIPFCLLLFS